MCAVCERALWGVLPTRPLTAHVTLVCLGVGDFVTVDDVLKCISLSCAIVIVALPPATLSSCHSFLV